MIAGLSSLIYHFYQTSNLLSKTSFSFYFVYLVDCLRGAGKKSIRLQKTVFDERPQFVQVLEIRARIVVRCLKNERRMGQLRMLRDTT